MTTNTFPPLSHKFAEAVLFAIELHANQVRKGKNIPYIAHIFSVTALVLEMGGNEEECIAALLHDAVEDQGGYETLNVIQTKFGEHVANIVSACTDSFTTPKPPWTERKRKYIEHLQDIGEDVFKVVLADKIHNARTILLDLRAEGDQVWERFNGGKEGTLWYYNQLREILCQKANNKFTDEFARLVTEINKHANRENE